MNLSQLLFFALSLVFSASSLAQDTIQPAEPIEKAPLETSIQTIEVTYPKGRQSSRGSWIGTNQDYFGDSIINRYATTHLAELLTRESHFFIKNYGPSNLATPANRGGSSAQTSFLWEGIDLQNRMLGQTDLSTIPNIFLNAVAINYGNGTRNLAGAVNLFSETARNTGFRLLGQLSYGSFYNTNVQLALAYGGENYAGSIRTFYHWGLNNFKYLDLNAFGLPKPKVNQVHAAVLRYGILQENRFQGKRANRFSLKTWYQYNKRQLPASLIQDTSTDVQFDESIRFVFRWDKDFLNQPIRLNTAHGFTGDRLDFKNVGIDSRSKIWTVFNSVSLNWVYRFPGELNFSHTYIRANSTAYEKPPQQHQLRFTTSISPRINHTYFRLSLQEELQNQTWSLPAFHLGVNCFMNKEKSLTLKVSLGHQYRFPTFNDLYWTHLGNPNLKPEYNWSVEFGTVWTKSASKLSLTWNNAIYSHWVRDWLLWRPNSQGLWRPENLERVWSRGLESRLDLSYTWNKNLQFKLRGLYAWNLAIRTAGADSDLIGKRLIYTPAHQGSMRLSLVWKDWNFSYQHHFVGKRFIDATNDNLLPFYHVANVDVFYQLKCKKFTYVVFAKANNIWGQNYQVISNRVMPWQQFELGIKMQY